MVKLFDRQALELLAAAVRSAPAPPSLRLRLGTSPSAFADRLSAAAREIAEGTGGAVALRSECSPGPESALILEVAGREVVRYQAVPGGPEAAPFVEAVLALTAVEPAPGVSVERPTAIEVFIAAGCPNCPQAVRSAIRLAVADPLVTVTVIDVDEHRARAEAVHVQSVPTTVVDGGLTVVGVLAAADLAQRMAEARGPAGRQAVLSSQLDAGRFEEAAAGLSDAAGARAFASLWLVSTLESRISLLLAAEEALERDARSLDGLAVDLLPGLQAVDVALRGDTADLLGRIGHPLARQDLELLLSDPVADVAEAAREALTGLRDDRAGADPEDNGTET